MATTIKLKNGSGAPLAGDLVQGEPALDLTNKRLYTEDSGGTVIEVGTNPTSLTTGTFTSTGIDDNATSTAITIDSSENVGIGTTSPDTLLELAANNNSGAENNTLRFTDISANTSANQALGKIEFKTDDSSGDGPLVRAYIGAFASDTTPSTYLSFATNLGGAGTVAEEAMRINSSGEVLSSASGSWRLRPDANSALAPSYAFNGDGNTGMYSPTSDTLGFSTQGTEKMRIDSSGRVGIGTASPSYQFTVQNTGNATSAIIAGTTSQSILNLGDTSNGVVGQILYDHTTNSMRLNTAAAERMRIDSAGNVGIGTDSPDYKLEVEEIGAGSGLGGIAAATAAAEGNAGYRWVTDGTSRFAMTTAGSAGSELRIYDNNNAIERMRIDDSGNIGIGTTSPASRLHISPSNGSGDQGDVVFTLGNETNNARGATITKNTSSPYDLTITAGLNAGAGSALVFNSNPNTETMRIDANGNVGIGTSNATPSNGGGLCIGSGSTITRIDMRNTTTGDATGDGTSLQLNGNNFTIENREAGYVAFSTSLTERMRIDSSGNLLVGRNSGIGNERLAVKSTALTCTFYSANSTANGTLMSYYSDVGGTEQQVAAMQRDGDIANTNNSYGALSDERLKSNIVDASSQIDDIMAVQVRSYTLDSTGDTHIGVVAQELEASGMSGLVKENEDGMKSVKYSILYMKAIKALQEAVTRIETLEAEVAALKGA